MTTLRVDAKMYKLAMSKVKVSKIMTKDLITATLNITVEEALRFLLFF